ncbi:hypothetical protein KP509_26G060300 [Ceratopteris richardii]|uniref:START domain-containing protein n=1 Tax=Ceratopteris richardii TaxID=49495 RepID=A0A8T2RP08_CERRI|nr:hypothetical protein KP509_26G060300 [Ceratopteris richardii]
MLACILQMASITLQETINWKEDIESVIEQSSRTPAINGTIQVYRSETRERATHERAASASDSELRAFMVDEDKVSNFMSSKRSGSSSFLADMNNESDSQVFDPTLVDIANDVKHWRLVRCQNGLRIFEEITEDFVGSIRAMKAVGVVDAQCEDIFSLVMGMDEIRNEWDSTFHSGMMVTEVDGHRAILYHRLQLGWCSWLLWPRDLCYTRYWRRIENGTYVVVFQSTEHPYCPPQPGCVRAHIESGGFRISPLRPRQGVPRTRVEHQIQIDWRWGISFFPYIQYQCLVQMLNSVAGLREWFAQCDNAKLIPHFSRIRTMDTQLTNSNKRGRRKHPVKDISAFMQSQELEAQGEDDESDDEDDGHMGFEESAVKESPMNSLPTSASEPETADSLEWPKFPSTVLQDDNDNARNSYSIPDGNNFRVRSKLFHHDRSKVLAGESLMQLVSVDWFKFSERMDHLARRKGCAAQIAAEKGLFTLLFNLQVPGSTHYSMVLYFVAKKPIPAGSLLQKFIDGDDGFRNNRLKLIPSVPKGSWIVRQSVGSTPCILGKAVDCNYYRGKKYLEVDVDIGSSTVANGVLGLVFGVVATLVVDMAFLVQGNTVDELPERLIGTVRISRLELSKAVSPYSDKDSAD